jgi:hypothetical protein
VTDAETVTPTRVFLDPSVVMTEDAVLWLDDRELRPSLVISASMWERMLDPDAEDEFRALGLVRDPAVIGRLRDSLESVPRFSHRDVGDLPDEVREVRDALLSSDEPLKTRKQITCTYTFLGVTVVLCRLPWMSKSRWRESLPGCFPILMSVSDG